MRRGARWRFVLSGCESDRRVESGSNAAITEAFQVGPPHRPAKQRVAFLASCSMQLASRFTVHAPRSRLAFVQNAYASMSRQSSTFAPTRRLIERRFSTPASERRDAWDAKSSAAGGRLTRNDRRRRIDPIGRGERYTGEPFASHASRRSRVLRPFASDAPRRVRLVRRPAPAPAQTPRRGGTS